MKTNILATACVLIFIMAVTILGSAVAQTVTVGVSPGNTFTYSYVLLWDSTDQTATIPAEYTDLNQTQSIQITIISVSGSLVNMDVTKNFRNGTDSTENGNTDVDRQIIDISYSFLIVRSDANPNEKRYPSGGHATFSETTLKTFPIGQIETITYRKEDISENDYEKTEIFYDRATGIAMEYQNEQRQTSGAYETTTRETLILESRTLTATPEFPLYVIIPIAITVAAVLIVLLARRRHKPSTPRTEQKVEADETDENSEDERKE